MGPLAGGLLSAGASLISGLFGRDSAKKQQQLERDLNYEAYLAQKHDAERENEYYINRADSAARIPVLTKEHSNVVTYDRTTEDETITRQGGVDMGSFIKAAEGYGFNPLTFLRSGALALFSNDTTTRKLTRGGFTQTVSDGYTETTGEHAMEAALVGFGNRPIFESIVDKGMTRVPSTGEVFGNALVAGTNQYLNASAQQDQNNFQCGLVQMQLDAAQRRDAQRYGRSFYTPVSYQTGGTSVSTAGKGAGTPTQPGSPGGGYTWLPELKAWVKSESLVPEGSNEYAQVIDALNAGTEDFTSVMSPPRRNPDGTYTPNPRVFSRPLSDLVTDWADYYTGGRYTPIRDEFWRSQGSTPTRTKQGAMPGGKYRYVPQ